MTIHHARGHRTSARAFTLIEVLIVIAIIVGIGALVTTSLVGKKKEAAIGFAQADMNTLENALKEFYVKYDRYPSDTEGLKVLWDKTALENADTDGAKWSKFLEKPLDLDRWGTAWGYKQKGDHNAEGDDKYDLWSFGPDRQEGTDDDLTSWPKDATGTGGPSSPSGSSSSGSNRK